MSNNQEWARVSNGRIVEYPVKNILPEERGVTVLAVTVIDSIGELTKFHKKVTNMTLEAGRPVIRKTKVLKSDSEFVKEYYLDPLIPYMSLAHLRADTIPQEVFKGMVESILQLGTMQLDRFAQEKGYDNIISLVSYRDDINPVFAAQAKRGIEVRSAYWTAFNDFQAFIEAGNEFPRTVEGITKLFPDLKWG